MVSQNQMSSDFYDYSYTTLQDNDDDELTIAFLMTLLSFYDKYMSKSPNYILSHIDKDIKKLQSNLLSDLKKYDEKTIIDKIREKLDYYDEFDYDVTQTNDVTESTINAIIQQLHQDIITKALVWIDQGNELEEFDIKANYQRAVKRLRDTASYYNGMVRQKVERTMLQKIYGNQQLYYWRCYGRRPCAWCIEQSKMPPRPLNEIPFDHPNGECGLEPAYDNL